MPTHPVIPKHQALFDGLIKLLADHTDELSGMEILAVASNMVGKLIAWQDPARCTRTVALEILMHNVEIGIAECESGAAPKPDNVIPLRRPPTH